MTTHLTRVEQLLYYRKKHDAGDSLKKKHKIILRVDLKKALFSRSQKRSHGRAESAPHSVPGLALDFAFFLSARLNRELLKSNDDGDVKRIETLRSNDADGNENVKKNNWFNKQNNNFAILRFMQDVNK